MELIEGQRVKVEGATGDRRRFEGRVGVVVRVQDVVRVQERLFSAATPLVHVRLDGLKRSYVLWPRELVPEDGGP